MTTYEIRDNRFSELMNGIINTYSKEQMFDYLNRMAFKCNDQLELLKFAFYLLEENGIDLEEEYFKDISYYKASFNERFEEMLNSVNERRKEEE